MPFRSAVDIRACRTPAERAYRLDAACEAVAPLVGSGEVLTWYVDTPGRVEIEVIAQPATTPSRLP